MKNRSKLSRQTGGRRCVARILVVLVAATAAPLAFSTVTWAAASAPDSARMASMQFVLRNFDDFRITSGGTRTFARDLDASFDGIRFRGPTLGSISTSSEQRLVQWSEIESIEARRGASHAGVLLGGLAGLAVGTVIVMADALSHSFTFSQDQPSGAPMLIGLVAGATLGTLIDRPGRWHAVYP